MLSGRKTGAGVEAARAIYDERMMLAMPTLAGMAEVNKLPDAVAYRALAANYILGEAEHAES